MSLELKYLRTSIADTDLFYTDPDPDPTFHFDTDPDPAFRFGTIRIPLFDMDPDPYRFQEVTYLKQYFLYILTWFSLSVCPPGPNQKAFFVKFYLPVNFVVLISVAS